MKIIGFVEGASPKKGGIGLVGTQNILGSLASRGHNIVLFIGGLHTPGREHLIALNPVDALAREHSGGSYGLVSFPAYGSWSFSPKMIRQAIRHVRDADFVSLHSFYSFPVLLGYIMARVYCKPYGVWPHGVFGSVHRRSGIRKKWLYDTLIGRSVREKASVIFYSAKGEREDSGSLNANLPSVIIPDGIDMDEFADMPQRGAFRSRFLGNHQGPLVLFVARLTAKKGLDLLLRAMNLVCAKRPDVRLAIVGAPDPASFMSKVNGWISETKMENYTIVTGRISPREKLEALSDADVFALPSEAENFGFSMFEAMASRVPVVVSDTLDFGTEVAAADAGFAVERNPGMFAEAILKLIDNPELRAIQGSNGYGLATLYSCQQTGVDLDRVVRSIHEQAPLPSDLTKLLPIGGKI